tara:strand:- start:1780 stop:2076 length:297 start_codon:yes stop_codon:yes gene_type:complete
MNSIINKAYKMFMRVYDNEMLKEKYPIRHEQLPIMLAFMAVELDDCEKLNEISDKYGSDIFNTPIGGWGSLILSQFNIITQNRATSPTCVADISFQEY